MSLTLLGSALPAAAHNGVGAAFKGRAGPYTVYAYDGYTLPDNELQYRLVLLDASSGGPANDVRVKISASSGTFRATTTANVYANVVFYTLANPYPGNWRVDVRLDGSLGHGEVTFPMHGYQGRGPTGPTGRASTTDPTPVAVAHHDSAPVATIVAASCASAAIAGAVVAFIWRRRRLRQRSAS
jgi:hypothetical protein